MVWPWSRDNLRYALSATTLFEGSTTDTVTLSQSAANFSQIRIDYQYGDGETFYGSDFIQNPNGTMHGIYMEYPDTNDESVLRVKTRLVRVSGTSITNVRAGAWAIYSGSNVFHVSGVEILITKVVGWV